MQDWCWLEDSSVKDDTEGEGDVGRLIEEDEDGRPKRVAKGLDMREPYGFAVEVEGRGGRGGLLGRG